MLMMPGPLRLFWTTGVFYLWELRDKYRIILVVPAEYQGDAAFEQAARSCDVFSIMYLPSGGIVRRHILCRRLVSDVARLYRPSIMLLHNRNYPENMYAISCCRRITPGCLLVAFQNGRWPVDWEVISQITLEYSTGLLAARWRIPSIVAKIIVIFGRHFLNVIDHRVLPLLLTGRMFYPFMDTRAVHPIKNNLRKYITSDDCGRDYTLAYHQCEIDAYHKVGFPPVTRIIHPARSAGTDAFTVLYGVTKCREEILVLPTMGFVSKKAGSNQSMMLGADTLSARWVDALIILMKRFPNASIGMKLHPLAGVDPLWKLVSQKLQAALPEIKVYPVAARAEHLILAASVIVSDISTTLWWALLVGGKTVVSLDLFDYAGGDEMRHYDNIIYISNLKVLEEAPLVPQGANEYGMPVRMFFEMAERTGSE